MADGRPLPPLQDLEPSGTIPLDDITLALASRQTAKNHCIGLFHPARPSYFIHARDDNEMMEWVRAIRRDDNKVGLIDFETLTVLGKGNFGKVLLVKQKMSKKLYAMKVLNKEVVIKRNDIQHAREERKCALLLPQSRCGRRGVHSCARARACARGDGMPQALTGRLPFAVAQHPAEDPAPLHRGPALRVPDR